MLYYVIHISFISYMCIIFTNYNNFKVNLGKFTSRKAKNNE